MTCAKNEVMKRIHSSVMLKFHEAVAMPTLLYGCETWDLKATEMKQLERVELWALKKMFGLPPTTPNGAVRYTTGTLFMEVRIHIKQIMFLHHLLQKENGHFAKGAVSTLRNKDIGWLRNIEKTLTLWELTTNWDTITKTPKNAWKLEVQKAAEKRNKVLLLNECQTKDRGTTKNKTKTKTIAEKLEGEEYKRAPAKILKYLNCMESRALIMGRYGMLDCRANFSNGYGDKICDLCYTHDDERHRMNECVKFRSINRCDNQLKIPFDDIYHDD